MASTLKQIAEIANVSRGTVDRVIHGRYGVDPKTRARVLAVMQELDYKPSSSRWKSPRRSPRTRAF